MAVMDVLAKTAYGLGMLFFRVEIDKAMYNAGITKKDLHKLEGEAKRNLGGTKGLKGIMPAAVISGGSNQLDSSLFFANDVETAYPFRGMNFQAAKVKGATNVANNPFGPKGFTMSPGPIFSPSPLTRPPVSRHPTRFA
jgi:hypothetical protein